MVQYYSLDEAARMLGVTTDKLKEMARKGEVRAFQDRGNLRFRSQEIDELARSMGLGSDPELQYHDSIPLADDPPPSPGSTPRSGKPKDSGVKLDFELSDEGSIPLVPDPPPSSGRMTRSSSRPSTLKAPPPVSGDSDVRLVGDGSGLDFRIEGEPTPSSRSQRPSKLGGSGKSKLKQPDSGIRIDKASDSDAKIVGDDDSQLKLGQRGGKKPSDSDIRMDLDLGEPGSGSKLRDRNLITEEIDLDAEALKAEESNRPKSSSSGKVGKTGSPLPTSSPFELTDDDSSDEFELAADDSSRSPLDASPLESSPLEAGSEEVPLIMGDDEVTLGELTGAGGGSGINLKKPADSGISLEQGGSEEIEFELTLDSESGSAISVAPPQSGDGEESSEFELSIKDDGEEADSSSEFELTLDGEESAELSVSGGDEDSSESDSEFELTLDDSGGLAGSEDVEEAADGEDKDIFETDFEVPALDDESASEAVALDSDTDVETQDFDLGESDSESESQVVELDDEADSGAATVKRPSSKKKKAARDEDEDTDLLADDDLEEEEDELPARVEYRDAPPADWGVAAPIGALLCSIILFVVGLMSFELVQGMWGYQKSNKVSSLIIDPIARMVEELPKTD